MLRVTPTIAVPEQELHERFVRASGPGGQNVNKVSTAVELRFDVAASALPGDVKARLIALAGRKITDAGILIIDSREHRTQAQNRAVGRARLAALIRQAAERPRRRKKTSPTRAARERRLVAKVRKARLKARRRPIRGEEE